VADPGTGEGARWAQMRTHRIMTDMLAELGASSKLNAERDFVEMLWTEGRRAAAECVRQRARGGAHVVHGHDRLGAGHPGERRADRLRHALVKLVGHDTPDVVRLDDAREITQCGTCPPMTRPVPP